MKKTKRLSTTHWILLSFLSVILLGSVLLWLPISSADGQSVSYIDALFTATTSTCVTGLVTVPTLSTWSVFGQAVILVLIQIGGLGVITVMAWFMLLVQRKMGLSRQLLIQDAFNLTSRSDLGRFLRRVVIGTLTVESLGALLCMTVFVPDFGAKGIWISVFHSISAFCNAGIDILSENSLCDYALNPTINIVTSLLIIFGGIGYIVWWDVLRALKHFPKQKLRCLRKLTLHSKVALSTTALLLFGGGIAFFLLEYNNPLTMQNLGFWDRVQLSLFQSVTTRTAGFASLPQQNLTNGSTVISLLLMFIGGSPVGTAGGIKTVTLTVLIASAVSNIRGRQEVSLFRRQISREAVGKATAVVSMSFFIVLISTVLLSVVTPAPLDHILYETVSATATVGLSCNLTGSLQLMGKLIILVTMYLGRVGPISLAIAFNTRRTNPNIIQNPTEDISIG